MNLSSAINSFVLWAPVPARNTPSGVRAAPYPSARIQPRALLALNFNFISTLQAGGLPGAVKEPNLAWNLRPVTGGRRLGVPRGRTRAPHPRDSPSSTTSHPLPTHAIFQEAEDHPFMK